MRVLLDTHAILWYVAGDAKLSRAARTVMESPSTTSLISPASYWEIAIKISTGNYSLDEPFEDFFGDAISLNRFEVLPVEIRHAAALSELPFHHRDPFDRMLIAQAIAEDVPLVSADAAFDAYPIRRLW